MLRIEKASSNGSNMMYFPFQAEHIETLTVESANEVSDVRMRSASPMGPLS